MMQTVPFSTSSPKYAYVTLLLNSDYLPGTLTLAQSLIDSGTSVPLILLLSKSSIPVEIYNILTCSGYFQRIINIDSDLISSKYDEQFQLSEYLKREDLFLAMTKLNVWRLTDYDKVLYLDSDMLIRSNIDNLFDVYNDELDATDIIASSDSGWPDIFNSGLFVIKPSIQIFEKIRRFHAENNSFDGADQGILNEFFNIRGEENGCKWFRLPFTYNCTLNSNYEYLPALIRFRDSIKVFHFIGLNKPWKNHSLCYSPTYAKIFNNDQDNIFALWWKIFKSVKIETDSTDYTSLELLEVSNNLSKSFADLSLKNEPEKVTSLNNPVNEDNERQTSNSIPNPFLFPTPKDTTTSTNTPHFPTFYYKKPSGKQEKIRDESKGGEAWKMSEGKFQWPQSESIKQLPPPILETRKPTVSSTSSTTQRIFEDTPVDKYVQAHPIFPWEKTRTKRDHLSRTFANAIKYSPPAYSISIVNSPSIEENDEENDDEGEESVQNLVGFEDGDTFQQYLKKVEAGKTHSRNVSSASNNIKIEMKIEDQFEGDLENAEKAYNETMEDIADVEDAEALATDVAENKVLAQLDNMDNDEML